MGKELTQATEDFSMVKKTTVGDWYTCNSQGAEKLTDDHLVVLVSKIEVVSGWGLLSELVKRFEKYANLDRKRLLEIINRDHGDNTS